MDPVVVDHGSLFIRAGYANPDNEPAIVLPSEFCLSQDAASLRTLPPAASRAAAEGAPEISPGSSAVVHPIQRGVVQDWDVMADVWRFLFYNQMGWEEGNEGSLLMVEQLFTPKTHRERMTQILFEDINVAGLSSLEQPLLSLYAFGRLTGCVVDCGHGKIDIAAVCDGAVQHASAQRWHLGGQDLDQVFSLSLEQQQQHGNRVSSHPDSSLPDVAADVAADVARDEAAGASSSVQRLRQVAAAVRGAEAARRGREQTCAMAVDSEAFERRMRGGIGKGESAELRATVDYTLPDGKVIQVGPERWAVGELLFNPAAVSHVKTHCATWHDKLGSLGSSQPGIVERLLQTAEGLGDGEKCRQVLDNVVLVGGLASMKGFRDRFAHDVSLAASSSMQPAVLKAPDYMVDSLGDHAAWIGGAIVAKVVFSQNQYMTKADYDENGPSVIHRKCL